jgi:hypothetical protein
LGSPPSRRRAALCCAGPSAYTSGRRIRASRCPFPNHNAGATSVPARACTAAAGAGFGPIRQINRISRIGIRAPRFHTGARWLTGGAHIPGRCPNPTCERFVFRPILLCATVVDAPIAQPLATCTERTDRHVWVVRQRGRDGMRTSQWRHRMEPFVIECFTPSCHVDIAPGAEVVPATSSDQVDSILAFAAGETCTTKRTRRLRGADFR